MMFRGFRNGGIAVLFATLLFSACSDDGDRITGTPDPVDPLIESIEPDSAAVGETVQIMGLRFGSTRGSSQVLFGAVDASTSLWSDERIDAVVPDGASTGTVHLVVEGMSSNSVPFTVLAAPPAEVQIDALVPTRTVVSDTVLVRGSGFGNEQGTGVVTFAGESNTRLDAEVITWTDAQIAVRVPEGSVSGVVRVSFAGQVESNDVNFSVAPAEISFSVDLSSLFQSHGCAACHGGSGGLFVDSPEGLLSGGNHGPAVVARDSEASILLKKVGPSPPFGERMPFGCETGGTCLTDEEILVIADWIDQGARDN